MTKSYYVIFNTNESIDNANFYLAESIEEVDKFFLLVNRHNYEYTEVSCNEMPDILGKKEHLYMYSRYSNIPNANVDYSDPESVKQFKYNLMKQYAEEPRSQYSLDIQELIDPNEINDLDNRLNKATVIITEQHYNSVSEVLWIDDPEYNNSIEPDIVTEIEYSICVYAPSYTVAREKIYNIMKKRIILEL